MLVDIEMLHTEMRELTLRAGVKIENINQIASLNNETPKELLEGTLDFLISVRNHEYEQMLKIWNLLPKEIWDRYLSFGETALREQLLLREQFKLLRKRWNKYVRQYYKTAETAD